MTNRQISFGDAAKFVQNARIQGNFRKVMPIFCAAGVGN